MQASFARFNGETVIFIKPDDAVELVKISGLLQLDLKALEPKEVRVQGMRAERRPLEVKKQKECFYCGGLYSVKVVKTKVWRDYCQKKQCRSWYARDRYLYNHGRENEMHRHQAVRMLKAAGLKASLSRR